MTEWDFDDDPYDDWFEMFQATLARFEAENDDLEATLTGDVGVHSFFTAGSEDVTRGTRTAVLEAFDATALSEVTVDADLVEAHYGDVTPQTVWDVVESQMNERVYLDSTLREEIAERVKTRVADNISRRGGEDE